ncbi:hypothetical protein KA089_02480 [Candidatus Woesebacteria bacterium]|nr:hypothetical protein [Candidatus Woesebacteria bacterium]
MKKNHLYWLFFFLIFVIGLAIRVIAIVRQPLWLDEQYSLFFSQSLSSMQFFVSTPDIHPGLYYFFVKLVVPFSSMIPVLRVFTALLPSMIGTIILLVTCRKWQKFTPLMLMLSFALLWLNPFLINFSWQLRMYGLLLLLISLVWFFANKWAISHSNKDFFSLLLFIILGQATSYVFYFWTFCFMLLHLSQKTGQLHTKKNYHLVLISLFTVTQFCFQSLGQVKEVFLGASWIQQPNIASIISLIKTVFGFQFDTMLNEANFTWVEFLLLLSIIYMIFKSSVYLIEKKSFLFLVLLPSSIIVLLSFLLHFLSQRYFIHQFIPDISLFLPRAFMLQYVMFAVLMPKMLTKILINKPLYIIISIIFLSTIWMVQSRIFWNPIYASEGVSHQINLINSIKNKNEIILFPSWLTLELISEPNQIDSNFITIFNQSQLFEKKIIEYSQNEGIKSVCELSSNKIIFMKRKAIINKNLRSTEFEKTILECCNNSYSDNNYVHFECK